MTFSTLCLCLFSLLGVSFATTLANITTLAGSGGIGRTDGPPLSSRFRRPTGVAVDPHFADILYVADFENHIIRMVKLTHFPDGALRAVNVSTLAGSTGGFADGEPFAAQFLFPIELAVDPSSNNTIYVADSSNNRIRVITLALGGARVAVNVTTLAGNGTAGFRNGAPLQALFSLIKDVAFDSHTNNTLYVADCNNNRIRVITLTTEWSLLSPRTAVNVTTLAGSVSSGAADGVPSFAALNAPMSVATDLLSPNYLYVGGNGRILVITLASHTDGVSPRTAVNVATLAGNGTAGFADGLAASAMFIAIGAIAFNPQGNGSIYVADQGNNRIREVSLALLQEGSPRVATAVATVVGNGTRGFADGSVLDAMVKGPAGVAFAIGTRARSALYIADYDNNRIRAVNLVTTLSQSATVGYSTSVPNSASVSNSDSNLFRLNRSLSATDFSPSMGSESWLFSNEGTATTAGLQLESLSRSVVDDSRSASCTSKERLRESTGAWSASYTISHSISAKQTSSSQNDTATDSNSASAKTLVPPRSIADVPTSARLVMSLTPIAAAVTSGSALFAFVEPTAVAVAVFAQQRATAAAFWRSCNSEDDNLFGTSMMDNMLVLRLAADGGGASTEWASGAVTADLCFVAAVCGGVMVSRLISRCWRRGFGLQAFSGTPLMTACRIMGLCAELLAVVLQPLTTGAIISVLHPQRTFSSVVVGIVAAALCATFVGYSLMHIGPWFIGMFERRTSMPRSFLRALFDEKGSWRPSPSESETRRIFFKQFGAMYEKQDANYYWWGATNFAYSILCGAINGAVHLVDPSQLCQNSWPTWSLAAATLAMAVGVAACRPFQRAVDNVQTCVLALIVVASIACGMSDKTAGASPVIDCALFAIGCASILLVLCERLSKRFADLKHEATVVLLKPLMELTDRQEPNACSVAPLAVVLVIASLVCLRSPQHQQVAVLSAGREELKKAVF